MSKIKISIIAGCGLDRNGKPLENLPLRLELVKEEALKTFGFYTIQNHVGGWTNDGHTFVEPGVSVFVVVDDTENNLTKGLLLAGYVKGALTQQSVCFSVEPVQSFTLI